jgi:hypothetical protein
MRLGFGVWGLESGVQGLGSRVENLAFRVEGLGCEHLDLVDLHGRDQRAPPLPARSVSVYRHTICRGKKEPPPLFTIIGP